MHISGLWSDKKVDIHTEEVDIRDLEVDIESFFADKTVGFSGKTQSHIRQMFEKFGFEFRLVRAIEYMRSIIYSSKPFLINFTC